MVGLLNNIQNWVQNGPMGNDRMQDEWADWSLDDLITAEGPAAVYEAAGFHELGEDPLTGSQWAELYGAYLTPYDPTAEGAINLNFMDVMTQKFTEAYGGIAQSQVSGGRTGFGHSYAAGASVQDVLSNTAAGIGTARHQKDQAIHNKRTDWVEDLWNDFAYLAQLGALQEDD